MAADDGADVAQAYLSLQLRKTVLHGVHDQPGVLRALAVADKALAVIVPAALADFTPGEEYAGKMSSDKGFV